MSKRKMNKEEITNVVINNYYPNQEKPTQSVKSKVLAFVLGFCTITGITGLSILQWIKDDSQDDETQDVTINAHTESLETEETILDTSQVIEYEVYLNPEYNRTSLYVPLDINVKTNFDATAVSLTANLNSGKTDILNMNKTGENEWELKVQFNESGIHEIIATANIGDEVIESLPVNITVDDINIGDVGQDQISDFFEMLYLIT